MKSVKILIDNKIPFIKGALDDIADVSYMEGAAVKPSDVRDMDALIIRTRTICNEVLLHDSTVRFIASATIGFDHIDTEYCKEKGICWTNSPGCNSGSVKQHFVSAVLELWSRSKLLPAETTIGIIGVGNVGSRIAEAAKTLGMNVLLNDPPRSRVEGEAGFVPLERILKEADFISFHVPLNMIGPDRTYKMAGREFFDNLRKPVHFMNTSRGSVVDESSLLSAIRSGKIRSCVLDVWENEPFINTELLQLADIATPHIAGYSTDGKANGTRMSVRAVSNFFRLGIGHWNPDGIPLPHNDRITIDCNSRTGMEILSLAYRETYSVVLDDEELRKNPSRFELLRGNYRVRREPEAFTVHLKNNTFAELPARLRKLGFSVMD
jgi:erythronate-4-phosphate dehydrogenase